MRLHWCTLSGGERVRGGCDLLAARRVVLPKEVTAEGFTRHPSAAAYRREVASRLLGSTAEKLEAVGKLLRVTRTPKLGEQLQVRFISDRLHDALPELDRSEINQLADGWDQLDEIQADLDRSADAVEIVEGFTVRSWRPWVRAVAFGAVLISFVFLFALVGLFWTPHGPAAITGNLREAPSLAHWLGTDNSGFDIASRLIAGAKLVLLVGLGSV